MEQVQAWTMACAAACLLVPIMSLPGVFGGVRARPLHCGALTMQAAQRPSGAAAPTEEEQNEESAQARLADDAHFLRSCDSLCSIRSVADLPLDWLQSRLLPFHGCSPAAQSVLCHWQSVCRFPFCQQMVARLPLAQMAAARDATGACFATPSASAIGHLMPAKAISARTEQKPLWYSACRTWTSGC